MDNPLPKQITIGEKHKPAVEVETQKQADEYFERCVQHTMTFGITREEAEKIERSNIGYYAGYYGMDTQRKVQEFYSAVHPVFGPIAEVAG